MAADPVPHEPAVLPCDAVSARTVHWRIGGTYACGVGLRWSSQTVTSTRRRAGVTCRSCLRSRKTMPETTTPTLDKWMIVEPGHRRVAGRVEHDDGPGMF